MLYKDIIIGYILCFYVQFSPYFQLSQGCIFTRRFFLVIQSILKGQTVKSSLRNPCRYFKSHFLNKPFQQVFVSLINELELNETGVERHAEISLISKYIPCLTSSCGSP